MATALVQGARALDFHSNGTTSQCALGSPATSGNLISVSAYWADNTSTLTVTDNLNNSYTLVGSPVRDNVRGWSGQKAFAKNITGGTLIVTMTTSAAVVNRAIVVVEVFGADLANPLDGNVGVLTSGAAGTDTISSGSFTTTADGDFIDAGMLDTALDGAAITPGTAYTTIV